MKPSNSLFADDVSALATTSSKQESEAAAQRTVDVVVVWAESWKVMINAEKSEASFFTTWSREAQWMPVIRIEGEAIKQVKSPRLLGVFVDRPTCRSPYREDTVKREDDTRCGQHRLGLEKREADPDLHGSLHKHRTIR